eukprot:g11778.t1
MLSAKHISPISRQLVAPLARSRATVPPLPLTRVGRARFAPAGPCHTVAGYSRCMSSESDTADASSQPPVPITISQKATVFMQSALPMIAFGFLDNFIMIIAGDAIDNSLGVVLGISTMAAAGLGNAISDGAGQMTGAAVSNLFDRLGLDPRLTESQKALPAFRRWRFLGGFIGILAGCLIGMFPLLWMDTSRGSVKKAFSKVAQDGTIGKKQAEKLLQQFGVEADAKQMDDFWVQYDENKDGVLQWEEFSKLLADQQSKFSEKERNSFMLLQAAFKGRTAQLEQLLESGVDPSVADYDSRTALHTAACRGNTAIVELLLKHGADVNAVDRFGASPLYEQYGGVVIGKDSEDGKEIQLTSLMMAVSRGDMVKLRKLFSRGGQLTMVLSCPPRLNSLRSFTISPRLTAIIKDVS